MKYWIILDGAQRGPLSIEELSATQGVNADTPVWHEGLVDWTTCGLVPELAPLLRQGQAAQPPHMQQAYGNQPYQPYGQAYTPYGQPQYTQQPYSQQPEPNRMPPMPNNYLVWAILATICCCLPTGVVAIIYASKVSPAYMRGDYNAALDASSKAGWWAIISFVAGLIWTPFSILFKLL